MCGSSLLYNQYTKASQLSPPCATTSDGRNVMVFDDIFLLYARSQARSDNEIGPNKFPKITVSTDAKTAHFLLSLFLYLLNMTTNCNIKKLVGLFVCL